MVCLWQGFSTGRPTTDLPSSASFRSVQCVQKCERRGEKNEEGAVLKIATQESAFSRNRKKIWRSTDVGDVLARMFGEVGEVMRTMCAVRTVPYLWYPMPTLAICRKKRVPKEDTGMWYFLDYYDVI
eukprot:scaffold229838_cov50-Cyclotella_meneghiniana.AAC.5